MMLFVQVSTRKSFKHKIKLNLLFKLLSEFLQKHSHQILISIRAISSKFHYHTLKFIVFFVHCYILLFLLLFIGCIFHLDIMGFGGMGVEGISVRGKVENLGKEVQFLE